MKRLLGCLGVLLTLAGPAAANEFRLVDPAQAMARLINKAASGEKGIRRPDGYVYAVDVGQSLVEFARAGERSAYLGLRDIAVARFVRFDRQNPYIDGFVAWRIKPGEEPDASGTAEALRIAEGLLAGAEAFDRREDARLAHQILLGYVKHGYEDHGLWLIRNYFNFGTRAYSPNSYIVNYDLNLLQRWKAAEGEPLAARVEVLLRTAARENGLMNEILQPEVFTAIPLEGLKTFSPDGVHSVVNSCMVLERATGSLADQGRKFLDTVLAAIASSGPLRSAEFFVPPFLDGRTGMPVTRTYPADIFVQGCLARLSHQLRHPQAAAFRLSYLRQLDEVWGDGSQYDLLYLSEVVRTLRVLDPRSANAGN